jgi:RNA polymerase sigma-70 factor, ECF subfamily
MLGERVMDEATLLARLQHHESDAFSHFFEQYADRIYQIAFAVLGNFADAEEIVQATFLSVFQAIDQFEPRAKLSTWLFQIAHNHILMLLRRRHPVTSLPEEEEATLVPAQLMDWTTMPEAVALRDEAREEVRQALLRLPEPLRMAFVLRDIEAFSTAECAQIQDITAGACKVRLHRARLLLRERLSAYFSERLTSAGKEQI